MAVSTGSNRDDIGGREKIRFEVKPNARALMRRLTKIDGGIQGPERPLERSIITLPTAPLIYQLHSYEGPSERSPLGGLGDTPQESRFTTPAKRPIIL